MTNAEWMIKNGYKFSDLRCCFDSGNIVISLYDKILVRGGYIPFNVFSEIEDDFLKRWLDKDHKDHEEPILNNAEKKYLSAVIKPFRDKVAFICKDIAGYRSQNIVIAIADVSKDIYLPSFESETMYKGMKLANPYTLEELGI